MAELHDRPPQDEKEHALAAIWWDGYKTALKAVQAGVEQIKEHPKLPAFMVKQAIDNIVTITHAEKDRG